MNQNFLNLEEQISGIESDPTMSSLEEIGNSCY